MNAYVYRAALYCEDCAAKITPHEAFAGAGLRHPATIGDDCDSDCSPQSVANGGGEADSPQHCDECRVFLENPLTTDGRKYVTAALDEDGGDPFVLQQWHEFYEPDCGCAEWSA